MGDHHCGAARHQCLQRLTDLAFIDRVQMRSGLVQDQHWGIFQYRTGDGYPLPLSPGELHAPLAHQSVVAIGKGGDELMGVGLLGRGFDLAVRCLDFS